VPPIVVAIFGLCDGSLTAGCCCVVGGGVVGCVGGVGGGGCVWR